MAELPAPFPATVDAVYTMLAAQARGGDSSGIAISEAMTPCDRALFYKLRWAAPPRPFDGPGASRLATGQRWEDRLIDDLINIGCGFGHHQEKFTLAGGWLRGRIEGVVSGLPEAPKTDHLLECKSVKAEKFRAVVKHGVAKAEPSHWAQCQLGAHAFGLTRAAYWIVNKDTDERHLERVPYDPVFCLQTVARIERIAALEAPPARLRDDPGAFECAFCPASAICHGGAFARRNCRTCLSSDLGVEALTCARDGSRRNYNAQQAGCDRHKFLPGLVPLEQIDVRSEAIVYRRPDGSEWIDGGAL